MEIDENPQAKEELIQNMVEYRKFATQIKDLGKEQDKLKARNLALMQEYGLESFADPENKLIISKEHKSFAVGVDEIALAKLIGEDAVASLRTVHPSTIKTQVKSEELVESALKCINTKPGKDFTVVRVLKTENEEPVEEASMTD